MEFKIQQMTRKISRLKNKNKELKNGKIENSMELSLGNFRKSSKHLSVMPSVYNSFTSGMS